MIERQFLNQANKEWDHYKGRFEPEKVQNTTTYANYHTEKDFGFEPIGKRVIKDQDGNPIPLDNRDFEIMTDMGFIERPQNNTDKELNKLLDTNAHYSKDIPYSYWQEKANSGCFYNSKADPAAKTQFGKNNEFLKSEFKHFTHTKG